MRVQHLIEQRRDGFMAPEICARTATKTDAILRNLAHKRDSGDEQARQMGPIAKKATDHGGGIISRSARWSSLRRYRDTASKTPRVIALPGATHITRGTRRE